MKYYVGLDVSLKQTSICVVAPSSPIGPLSVRIVHPELESQPSKKRGILILKRS
jgi:hypothetical protein